MTIQLAGFLIVSEKDWRSVESAGVCTSQPAGEYTQHNEVTAQRIPTNQPVYWKILLNFRMIAGPVQCLWSVRDHKSTLPFATGERGICGEFAKGQASTYS